MTLSQLRAMARAIIPGCKSDVVSDTVLDLVLNEGVKDIAAYTKCLPTNKKFNVVADQSEYVISTVITDYLCPDKPGLYWNAGDGTTTDWNKLDPETLASLDQKYPKWRDRSSDDPMAYSIDGNTITITPPPADSLTSGFWLYYCKKPTDMTATTSYPFSGTTAEMTHLSIFDLAIVKYAAWQIHPMLGEDQKSNLSMAEYFKIRDEKYALYRRRPDIGNIAVFKGSL